MSFLWLFPFILLILLFPHYSFLSLSLSDIHCLLHSFSLYLSLLHSLSLSLFAANMHAHFLFSLSSLLISFYFISLLFFSNSCKSSSNMEFFRMHCCRCTLLKNICIRRYVELIIIKLSEIFVHRNIVPRIFKICSFLRRFVSCHLFYALLSLLLIY